MDNSVTHAAEEWLKETQKTIKLNKHQRRAVLAFAYWLDDLIQKQEIEEEVKRGKEN